MFGLGKRNEEAAPAEIQAITLALGVEAGWLTLTGDRLQLRISRADAGILTDREGLAQRFREAERPIDRREWNDEARARFVAMARLMRMGLTLCQVARILAEPEAEIRAFWAWAIGLKASTEDPALAELEKALDRDTLKLIPARVKRSELDNGEFTTSTRLTGPRVARLMRQGSVPAAAAELGVELGALERWIADNERLLEVLK